MAVAPCHDRAGADQAARDDFGQPAAEWLAFHRRGVPYLIAAAQDVYDDGDDAEKAAVAGELAAPQAAIVAEDDRRLATILKMRRDPEPSRADADQGRVRQATRRGMTAADGNRYPAVLVSSVSAG